MAARRNDLSAALGRSVAWLRGSYQLRQEDVAEAAIGAGLPWTQATVAGLETGRRRLSAVEMLLLPHVMSIAAHDEIAMHDLFLLGGADEIELTPVLAHVQPTTLTRFIDGSFAAEVLGVSEELIDRVLLEARACESLGVGLDELRRATEQRWPGRSLTEVLEERVDRDVAQAGDDSPGARRTARRLQQRPLIEELRLTLGRGDERSA